MLTSDLIGGVGGVLLAVPPLKDQFYRLSRARSEQRESTSPWPGLQRVAKRAWEERRNDYDGSDSAMTALGALALILSFLLKMTER